MKWLVALCLVTFCVETALAANILALCVCASHSHSLWCYRYMEALANRGHQITLLGVDEPMIKIANMTKFIATGVYEAAFSEEAVGDWSPEASKLSAINPGLKTWNEASSTAILHSQALKDLINKYKDVEKPFDLIIHDNVNAEALLGLVPLFGNPPLLLATAYGSPQWMTFRAGNIFNPAYVPSMITDNDQHMTLFERWMNTYYYLYLEYFFTSYADPFQDKLMREVFGNHLPYVRDIAKQANIVIVNYHFALNGPRPMLPGVIGIAGIHISDPKPLPKDLQEFIDGAEHGVILFSFGSNVGSSWFKNDLGSIVLKALAQLPQRVLWKWDQPLDNIPPNVKISKWLPQGDILAHPNVRLCVSHCGLLSTQEVVYHKVPVLALPVFLDQFDNAALLEKLKLTTQLNVYKLTTEELKDGINEILTNPMYKKNIERVGEQMRDMPQTSREQAVWWAEYAIRHQGAPQLKSVAADLSWYQLLLLDVLALTALMVLIPFGLIFAFLIYVSKKFRTPSKTKGKKD